MATTKSRSVARERRHIRVRRSLSGTPERPRLNVFRSLGEIYAQVIDDEAGHTLVSASSVDRDLRAQLEGKKKTEQARLVGQALAERAREKGIQSVVFDRGGYRYLGRVKALADGAREGGLEF
jgi:large subunit ribosomal protein L18